MAGECAVGRPQSDAGDAERSKTSTMRPVPADDAMVEDTGDISVSVSTTFYPNANLCGDQAPDLLMLTSDSVFFYVHSSVLLAVSDNRFGSLFPDLLVQTEGQPIAAIATHSSDIVNLLLHAAYKIGCMQFSPTLDQIFTAIHTLSIYGMQAQEHVQPGFPLFEAVMSHVPLVPLDVYALAARFDLFQLAAAASSHLLSIPLSAVTDDLATRIGPVYLKRLVNLHVTRMEKLKDLVLTEPPPHPSTVSCNGDALNRVWSFATASLAWEVRPDLSTTLIKLALMKGEPQLSCVLCKEYLRSRIDDILETWEQEKCTI